MFESLDFLYVPSRDMAADVEHFTCAGAELVFAIEAYGTRVAMLRLAPGGPDLLLADHLDGDRPVLVYRVADLETAVDELRARGCDPGPELGIPPGPCCSFELQGGHRIAVYELTRPGVIERFAGRKDF